MAGVIGCVYSGLRAKFHSVCAKFCIMGLEVFEDAAEGVLRPGPEKEASVKDADD
ncbi:MAG: hypothetical protein ChlgKO_02850 [Chlamydiales bacterium]